MSAALAPGGQGRPAATDADLVHALIMIRCTAIEQPDTESFGSLTSKHQRQLSQKRDDMLSCRGVAHPSGMPYMRAHSAPKRLAAMWMCRACRLGHGSQQSHRVYIIDGGVNHREGWSTGVAVRLCLLLSDLQSCVAIVEHLGRPCIDRTDLQFSTLACCLGPVSCSLLAANAKLCTSRLRVQIQGKHCCKLHAIVWCEQQLPEFAHDASTL